MTFDEKLTLALSATYETRAKQMLYVPQKHKFSLGYRLWEYRTLKNLSRDRFDKHWTLRHARHAVAAASVAVSLMLATTVYAVGSMIGRYAFETEPNYSKMFIESISSDKTGFEEYYGLPEEDGWKMIYYYDDETEILINYVRDSEKVTFAQRIITGDTRNINTENAVIEPVSLYNNDDGFFIEFQKDGGSGLYWIYDGYLMALLGDFNKSEAINLAYSTKISKL